MSKVCEVCGEPGRRYETMRRVLCPKHAVELLTAWLNSQPKILGKRGME